MANFPGGMNKSEVERRTSRFSSSVVPNASIAVWLRPIPSAQEFYTVKYTAPFQTYSFHIVYDRADRVWTAIPTYE